MYVNILYSKPYFCFLHLVVPQYERKKSPNKSNILKCRNSIIYKVVT